MTSDHLRPSDRLARLSPDRWQTRLALLLFAIAIILALMCENVNAAPEEYWPAATIEQRSGNVADGERSAQSGPQAVPSTGDAKAGSIPAGPDHFILSHPICTTGFLVAQRIDTRDRFGIIVKRQWVPGCARAPRIVYGRKV